MHRRVKELDSQAGRRVPPIESVYGSSKNPSEPIAAQSNEPFFIGDDIQFGEMNEVVEAESVVGRQPSPQPKPRAETNEEVFIETVEVVENEHALPPVIQEPIAKAVHGGLHGFVSWWNNANVSTPLKLLVLGFDPCAPWGIQEEVAHA